MNTKALPSASEELSSLLEELIKRISKKLPENVSLNFKAENESAELLLKLFDTLNILNYQL